MVTDRPTLGIALMLGFCIAAPLGDAIAKVLGPAVPLIMVIAVRFVIQAVLLVPLISATGGSLRVPQRLWPIMVLRTVLHIAGVALMFLALRYLPLGDAVAIAYVMPFLVLFVGWLTMGEEVGLRRLIACVVGFAGTLLVMQPSFLEVGPATLLPLAVAAIFAVFMLLTRKIAREIGPLELQAVNGLLGSGLLVGILIFGALFGWAEATLIRPDAQQTVLLVLLGVLGTLAHLLLTWSLRFAPTATVAPVQYLEIPVAVLFGLLIFGDFPGALALVGIAIVMAAGLYIILREQALAKAAPRAAPRPQPPGPPAAE
ncbi:MAG: DMT family transporter [Pseudomonadota bacterium]